MRGQDKKGIGMFEVVLGIAIIALALTGLIGGFRFFLATGLSSVSDVQATLLLEEGFEAVRFLRDEDYTDNIQSRIGAGTYYLIWNQGAWEATTTPIVIDGTFERTVVFEEARRDGSDDLTTSGGTVDLGTARVTVAVAWERKGTHTTRTATGYITNVFGDE